MRRMLSTTLPTLLLHVLCLVVPAAAQVEVVEYYHHDALGSVRAVTNAAGQVVSQHDYLPFGEEWQAPLTGTPLVQFTGKERDRETGLDYFGARYYRAGIGRFTTVDPALDVEQALVDPQRWNRYASSLNNPLKFVDPDGKNPLLIMGGAGAAVYGGWQVYQNLRQGRPWSEDVGVEASKGLLIGATLGLAAPAIAGTTAAEMATGAQAPAGLLPTLTSTTRAAFLETALAEGRGGVSAAGKALQSHASRAGSWLADLTQGGNAAANTAAARKALLEILQSGRVTTASHKVWGDVVYVRLSDGRGAVWTAKGEFITFLERYSPK